MNEIPSCYRIKFWAKSNKNDIRFAKIERYHSEAEEHWAAGNLLLSDAITGALYLAPFADIEFEDQPLGWEKNDPETYMSIDTEYDRYINDTYKEQVKRSEQAGKGLRVHKMFKTHVADGFANYVVTKVNKKTCKIEWRNFGADEYHDQILGYGGSFPIDIIRQQVEREEAMRELFSSCKEKEEKEKV